MSITHSYLSEVFHTFVLKNPHAPEFTQATLSFLKSIEPHFDKLLVSYPYLIQESILPRLFEPERLIQFAVPWTDDNGQMQINRGYRTQFNSAIGPYKGGIRFHPSVNGSIINFLGFEQTLKNALTTLPLGGGKGGSDFDPKGKTDNEIKRFCQSFMTELYRHIGPHTDVPAGDIGVSAKEVGYMYGQYKKITNEFTGTFTGKSVDVSGALGRKEATGYGLIYIVSEVLSKIKNANFLGQNISVSGSGNVAIYAIEKANYLGATVICASDSSGYIYDPSGIDIAVLKEIKEVKKARISEYIKHVPSATYHEGSDGIWSVPCDIALPCATQNEINEASAKKLIENGVSIVAEGSNMSTTAEGVAVFLSNSHTVYLPSKMANAGGVAVSGLEMAQNSARLHWSFESVDTQLKEIMKNIFDTVYSTALEYETDFKSAANISGFLTVAKAMHWLG